MSTTLPGQLRSLPARTWLRALRYAAIAVVVIGVPTDLVDTPVFGRPVATTPIDYVILAVSAALMGLILAIRPDKSLNGSSLDEAAVVGIDGQDTRTAWGGFVSFLAVGCPVCNQAVVALVGTSGALTWWAPVQPVIGALAIGLLLHTLRLRLRTYQLMACPIPSGPLLS